MTGVNTIDTGDAGLLAAYLSAANRGLITQKNANLLLSQQSLAGFELSSDLAVKSSAFQEELRQQANQYLQIVLPAVITTFSNGSNFSALVAAAQRALPNSNSALLAQADQIVHTLSALTTQARLYATHAAGLYAQAGVMNQELSYSNKQYDLVIAQIEQSVSADIKQQTEAIETLNQKIAQNIQGIVDGGTKAGEGVNKIGQTILASIDVTDKKQDQDKEKDKKNEDENKSKIDTQYLIAGLNGISQGASESSQSVRELRTNNEKLGVLYTQLAKNNSLLSVVKSIQAQNNLFVGAFSRTYQALSGLEENWQKVEKQFSSSAEIVATATSEQQVQVIRESLEVGVAQWNLLSDQMDSIKAIYAGIPMVHGITHP
ncbi:MULTISPECIES: hypothetical protein [Salinivibrio]|uniref:hypothetical protein n=1 Tax=Salinivibrio TaxID=51366 RepID=UPI00084C8D4D|nr:MULTISPECIES: hypothetical protein [Salinivibrio]ODP97833.1 hypothetical protein BGK46_12815 [Salinivibrio sp. DV]OOF24032.1 hypothetical protein BZJ19_11680 [Salinivibrio proteolyticus]